MNDADAELPRPFGPYMLLVRLARGGMGEVFFAKHGGLQGFEKHCVVKTLREDLAAQNEYVRRFTEEARVVVQLSHRNVCSVFDVGRAQGQLYVAMEHVVGRDLRSLAVSGPMQPALSVHIVSEVLEALDYAHRMVDPETDAPLSLVHRDVSPHNVLVSVEGDVKLIDFGIATSARVGPVTEDGTVLGKLTYMAPEHARGDDVDGRADEYSAAVLLVELLTGVPFNDGLSREEQWKISGIGGHRPQVFASLDGELRTILDRALHAKRDHRFPTCSMFGEAIVDWARKRGYVAGARDLRRLVAQQFPMLAAEVRSGVRTFADVRAPALDAVVKTPGFETIATTMMVAPTTAGIDQAPETMVVRDRKILDATLPDASLPRGSRRQPWLIASAAAVVAAVLGVAGGIAYSSRAPSDDGTRVIALSSDAGSIVASTTIASATPNATTATTTATTAPTIATTATATTSSSTSSTAQPALVPLGTTPTPTFTPTLTKPKLDAETKRNLAYLASCTKVVTCASGVLEYSRRAATESQRKEMSESAADCAHQCRLKPH
jgi:serine/threonine-protein kinase